MKNTRQILNNERGSVIVFAILILAILTIIGISSSNTSIMESQIVRNEAVQRQNFYRAESGVIEAAQQLKDLENPSVLEANARPWLNSNSADMAQIANWDASGDSNDNAQTSALVPNTSYSTVRVNVAKKASLGMENPDQLYEYAIYGLYNGSDGQAFIEAGFKKRY